MASSSKKELHVGYCDERACSVCHKCRDWYYDPRDHNGCDYSYRAYENHVGPLYNWHRRVGGTCSYARVDCPPLHDHHVHKYPNPAIHGPHICHCKTQN